MGKRQALEANRRPHRIFRWGHLLGIVLLYEQRCMGGGTHSPRSTGVGPPVGVKLMGSRLESYSVGSLLAPALRLSCDSHLWLPATNGLMSSGRHACGTQANTAGW